MSMATGTISKEEFARVREQIRRLVANPAGVDDKTLARIAREYAAAADSLNNRLVRCADWIARGLRTEAVHEAALPPDLSESLRALDLGAELREFEDLCAFHDIQLQYDLNWDLAGQLDDAIAIERELEAQSRSYRRACIGRQPLDERRRRLARLIDLDPMNDVWTDALAQIDEARLRILNRDSKAATDARDLDRLDGVLRQLLRNDWQIEIPERLVKEVHRARKRVAAELARGSLTGLANQLSKLRDTGDEGLLLEAAMQWENAVTASGGEVAADLTTQVRPAMRRAAEILRARAESDRHAHDCAVLAEAIDLRLPPKKLRALAASIRTRKDLPPGLEIRLADAIADARRRHMLFIGGFFAMVLVAVALITAAIIVRADANSPPATEVSSGNNAGNNQERAVEESGDSRQ